MKKCNWCGEMNKWSANFCTNCGKDPHGRAYPNDYANDQPAIESRPRSGLPVAGGILTIVAGIAALAMGLMSLIVGYVAVELGAYGVETISCCGLIWVVLGLLAFGGGLMAVQRKNFWLALGGSIAGIAGIGFILGAVFAFIGLILIAVSRQEFDQ